MRTVAWALGAAMVLISGCSQVGQQDASAAAVAFLQAQPGPACAMLAPDTADAVAAQAGKDCARAMAQVHLPAQSPIRNVEIAGQSAEVQFSDQAVFLARFPDGWRVTAAGCVRDDPDPAVPYDCEVKP